MTAEPKEAGKNSVYIMSVEGETTLSIIAGPYKSLAIAQKELNKQAESLEGKEIMLAKVFRRAKVKVQTVKKVSFE